VLPNPYVLLAAGVLAVALAIGGFTFGVKYQRGQEARAEQLIARVRDEAQLGAAEAIAKIEIKNTTIRQQLETVTREVPVYRDCRNTDDGMRLINDALRGPGAAGRGELSGTDAADR
jgi:hypothetical protein